MERYKTNIKVNYYLTIILIILGLGIAVISLILKPKDMSNISDFHRLTYNFFELLGFTLFSSGIFSIFLQLPDWKNYFEDRLKNIVLEQDYLNSLDGESLSNLQIKTLKAFFKTADIDKDGSFLNYFQENLAQYIKMPYRDNVKTEIYIFEYDNEGIWIHDRIMYNCKMVGGKIQEFVKWRPDEGEFMDIKSVEINVKKNNSNLIKVLELTKTQNAFKVRPYNLETPFDIQFDDIYKNGLTYPLKDFNEDNLFVEIKSKYRMEIGKFSNWTMANPTRNFYITINYPKNWIIRFQPLLLHPEKIITSHEDGLFSMQYNEWLLPYSGVVYSFVVKS